MEHIQSCSAVWVGVIRKVWGLVWFGLAVGVWVYLWVPPVPVL
jgi:hypothetical protein